MRKSDENTRQGRRDFLRKVAVAGGSAAVVAATSNAVATPVKPEVTKPAAKAVGYAETEHVRSYYRTCRT